MAVLGSADRAAAVTMCGGMGRDTAVEIVGGGMRHATTVTVGLDRRVSGSPCGETAARADSLASEGRPPYEWIAHGHDPPAHTGQDAVPRFAMCRLQRMCSQWVEHEAFYTRVYVLCCPTGLTTAWPSYYA